MATQAERLEALETEIGGIKAMLEKVMPYLEGAANGEPVKVTVEGMDLLISRVDDLEKLLKDGETMDELRSLVAKAAPLSDFETLTERVDKLEVDEMPGSGELIAAELVEGYDPRGEVLKAFRQIEAIANHINVKLPA
jgi:soluble cytochrome b562